MEQGNRIGFGDRRAANGAKPAASRFTQGADDYRHREGRGSTKNYPGGVYDYGAIARPYVLPPNTPKDRVLTLRKGLADTLKDPKFLADAKKARLDLDPLSGEELEKVVARVYKLEKRIIEKLKEILK